MSYRLEGKDIILDGFADGIADSPFDGIADMRNVEIVNIPGEGSVQYKQIAASVPPVLNAIPFTASESTDRLTWAGPNTLYEGCAISIGFANSLNTLVVAGGGGGAGGGSAANSGSGGGGAGGFKTQTLTNVAAGTYTITVGAGGAGGTAGNPGTDGANGSNSSIAALVVSTGGGGGGGDADANGKNGGSGGGAGSASGVPSTGGTGTVGQGTNGGNASAQGGGGGSGGGGGGGATSAGSNGGAVDGGNGGAGTASSISGSSVTYAGGGGGGAFSTSTGGTGGTGGGGTGGGVGGDATAGTANRGGGGGGGRGAGSSGIGAAGGSGIVVISYPTGTVTATGGTITTSGGNTIHTFTTSGSFVISTSGLAPSSVYYVRNIVGLTFQLSLSLTGPIIDLVGDSVGTFTTYQYGNQRGLSGGHAPVSYYVDRQIGNFIGVYLMDASNYIWFLTPTAIDTLPANSLLFMGNIDGAAASSASGGGVAIWNGYIFVFGISNVGVDLAPINDLFVSGPAADWSYNWWTISTAQVDRRVSLLVAQDDALYFTSNSGVGSILEKAGEVFDPTDSATYTRNADALVIPNDQTTCLAEQGTSLLIGGSKSLVYPWDRISTSYSYPIILPDNFTTNIVGTNQNAYIFAGNRGRIYITNGSSVDLFKKLPDYLTGIVNPYIRWRDASYARNQLYFSFTATTNADADLTTVNGGWAIDLSAKALRMVNKITASGYAGQTTMVTEIPPISLADNPAGTSIILGWQTSGPVYGVDVGSGIPYSSLESFIDFDLIPVGTYLDQFSPSQVEWKTSSPLGANGTAETIRILYRTNITDAFVQIGSTTATGTTVVGTTTGTSVMSAISDYYQVNFQKAQWIQLRVEMSSNATTPTFNRLTEIRIRDFNG